MRALSETFMHDLVDEESVLHPILDRIKKDHTLMLAIRQDYINIYYRGGNILRLEEKSRGGYKTSFDKNYNRSQRDLPALPAQISSQEDAIIWSTTLPVLKNCMDEYFTFKKNAEREFQQLVARENNDSMVSNESEYFIADIEAADSGLGARFDMLAIRWLANQRKTGNNCKAAFIEMKYADNALDGNAGLIKHIEDMHAMISNRERYAEVLSTMETQFNQLDRLGLMNFNKGISNAKVKLDPHDRPEVIFILANHNPRSPKLKSILVDPRLAPYTQSDLFDLRFFVSRFAGYGLHSDCMLTIADFIKLL